MSGFPKLLLANPGSTGTANHASARTTPAASKLCAVLIIEAAGATPTITAKIQGSLDDDTVADNAANWFDLPFITDTNDTVAASLTKTAVGGYPMWLSQSQVRFVKRVRLVTSANTNVTYRAELNQQYTN